MSELPSLKRQSGVNGLDENSSMTRPRTTETDLPGQKVVIGDKGINTVFLNKE